jgi:hypothetical protein
MAEGPMRRPVSVVGCQLQVATYNGRKGGASDIE